MTSKITAEDAVHILGHFAAAWLSYLAPILGRRHGKTDSTAGEPVAAFLLLVAMPGAPSSILVHI